MIDLKEENLYKPIEEKYNGNFTDMRVSDVGFGKDEYKTSKPNILRNDAVVNEIINISEATETAIGHTIGPYADATLIQTYADKDVPVYNTRDGFTILQNMKFTQPIPNAIFRIIRETTEYMQNQVGDSTSSGIPIQNSLLKKYVEIFNDSKEGIWKYSPVGIKNISDKCCNAIIKGITDNPKYQVIFPRPDENGKYTKEQEDNIINWLTKVATISANNDYETGRKIAELYRNKLNGRGSVLAYKSSTEEEYIEDSNAYIIPKGMFDPNKMANNHETMMWEADNPAIVMFDGVLEQSDLPAFKQIVETIWFDLKRPIFVTAHSYNFHIAQYLKHCIDGTYYNEIGEELNNDKVNLEAQPVKIDICCIILQNKEPSDQALFNDVKLMTNSHVFSTELSKLEEFSKHRDIRVKQLEKMFGFCEKIASGWADTNFIGCSPNTEALDSVLHSLNTKIEAFKKMNTRMMDYNREEIENRINMLQAKTSFYFCGGRTESVKYSRKLVVDDAISAINAAIKHGGVSIGGNMSVCHYITNNLEPLIDSVLDDIRNTKINITAAQNQHDLRNIVKTILLSIKYSFGSAYRYALYNMYRNAEMTMRKWEECLIDQDAKIYDIMIDKIQEFNNTDIDKCTTLLVPRHTDAHLLRIIIETVGNLINIGNMISLMSPNMDLEQLQLRQLETGAAYMAHNSILRGV